MSLVRGGELLEVREAKLGLWGLSGQQFLDLGNKQATHRSDPAAERRRREDGQNNAKNYEGGRQEGKEGEHQGK